MASFEERKKELTNQSENGTNRKVFNQTSFDKLGTALLNDPEYVAKVTVTKNGELVEKETTPVKDFRQKAIGDVLKKAGVDAAEQQKFVEEYQYPTLPLHGIVSEMLTEYMDTGRPFSFNRKGDFKASIGIEAQAEAIKEVKSPKTGEVKTKKYSAYRKLKAKSTCPDNLKTDI